MTGATDAVYKRIVEKVVKTCACGEEYTDDRWRSLRRVGTMIVPAGDGEPEIRYDLRNCVCGSTIARKENRPSRHD